MRVSPTDKGTDMSINITEVAPAVYEVYQLPRADRREALTALVVTEFKSVLLMTDEEELPLDESYFELGFTSLRITEIKQKLEDRLGCRLSTTLLFNSPTVDALMDHLVTTALPDLLTDGRDPSDQATESAGPVHNTSLDDLFDL